jgi:hypothetical protein
MVELKDPHAPALSQLTDHVTALRFPFTTPTENVAEALTAMLAGGAPRNKTEIGFEGGVMDCKLPPPLHPASPPTRETPKNTRTALQ